MRIPPPKRKMLIGECPARECESRWWVEPVTSELFPLLYQRLEEKAKGRQYDYYRCGRCHCIWRGEIRDRSELSKEPEVIGGWEGHDEEKAIVFDTPGPPIVLKPQYRKKEGKRSRLPGFGDS